MDLGDLSVQSTRYSTSNIVSKRKVRLFTVAGASRYRDHSGRLPEAV